MEILAKIILVLLMLFMVVNLFRALFAMLKNDPNKPSMSHYLGKRVMWSALAMIIIIILLASGVLVPHARPY
ncbi:DUF2909 domain-containing protein [Pseudidiomarina taiwanensis]|uniref:DUF2909 domain-containing protein n=1 Tax=Pseudidiomarina taiwanensis TaxID=337250 RepID=A0A432ZL38_9GAMM|nr:DUF2909 domain-containing protein [Pseudidiomarina taiwanensis]RUO78659.1 DUF2909 domain-containing protein [Pseudidiomarina taiwanensis]